MTTTTEALDACAIVSKPNVELSVEQPKEVTVEAEVTGATPKLTPSDCAVPVRWSELEIAGKGYQVLHAKEMTKSALFTAILALAQTDGARFSVKEEHYFFGIFSRRVAWISRGRGSRLWPAGSVESSLQGRVTETPVKLSDLIAKWIGEHDLPDPWETIRDRIIDRQVNLGIVERHTEKKSFLFFRWESRTYRLSDQSSASLGDIANVTRRTNPESISADQMRLGFGEGGAISGGIDKGFSDRTEAPDVD